MDIQQSIIVRSGVRAVRYALQLGAAVCIIAGLGTLLPVGVQAQASADIVTTPLANIIVGPDVPIISQAALPASLFDAYSESSAAALPSGVGVGRTPGTFQVSATGEATYTIPIWTPVGIAGLKPNLALVYASRHGDGEFGVGWSMGLSSISRCEKTVAQDGVSGAVEVTAADLFCLGGNKLRRFGSGTYGADGTQYQTEIADFSLSISHGAAGTGPAWFEVYRKDGLIYEYGNSTDSRILVGGTTSARTWALSKIRDRYGNFIAFTYVNDTANGVFRPDKITYVTSPGTSAPANYQVQFAYVSRATTPPSGFILGTAFQEPYLASTITIAAWNGGAYAAVRTYNLAYSTGSASGRSRISTITECSPTQCLSPSTVAYQDGSTGFTAEGTLTTSNISGGMVLDLNGDGIDDIVYPGSNGNFYYVLGTSSGTPAAAVNSGQSSANFAKAIPIDFNSDGKMDILVPNASGNWRVLYFQSAGSAFTFTDTTIPATGAGDGQVVAGDLNGDGRDDLVYAVSGGSSYATADTIYYRLNTGSAFGAQNVLLSFPNGASCTDCKKLATRAFGPSSYRYQSRTQRADFNGDGRNDFAIVFTECYPNPDVPDPQNCGTLHRPTWRYQALLSRPDGTYSLTPITSYSGTGAPFDAAVYADVNGDGCTDFVYAQGVWNVAIGNCYRSGLSSAFSSIIATTQSVNAATPYVEVADWDGDGRDDLIVAGTGTTPHAGVMRSTGTGFSSWQDMGFNFVTGFVADLAGSRQPALAYSTKYRLHSGVGVNADLATSFTDGFGNNASPAYTRTSVSSYYAAGASPAYPEVAFSGALSVVGSYTESDGIGGTYTVTQFYTDARSNLQGRGFEGFNNVRVIDSRDNLRHLTYFGQLFPQTGAVTRQTLFQSNGTTYIKGSSWKRVGES